MIEQAPRNPIDEKEMYNEETPNISELEAIVSHKKGPKNFHPKAPYYYIICNLVLVILTPFLVGFCLHMNPLLINWCVEHLILSLVIIFAQIPLLMAVMLIKYPKVVPFNIAFILCYSYSCALCVMIVLGG